MTQTESTLTPEQTTELSVVLDEIKGAWGALKPLPTLVKTLQEEQSGLLEKVSALRRLQLLRTPGNGSTRQRGNVSHSTLSAIRFRPDM